MPTAEKILMQVGQNIRLARLRRRHKVSEIAERTNIGRNTLFFIESGSAKVSIGKYLSVLFALGLEKDFLMIAGDDKFGRGLQDAKLSPKGRVRSRKK